MTDAPLQPPTLDLDLDEVASLPDEVPDVFDEAEFEAVEGHEKDIEMGSLLKDIRVCLEIGDAEQAKVEYRKLLDLFNRLPLEGKKRYFKKVDAMFDLVKHPRAAQKELQGSSA